MRFIIIVYLFGSLASSQDFGAILESELSKGTEGNRVAEFLVKEYSADTEKLTEDAMVFAISNPSARSIFKAFWRDIDLGSDGLLLLTEKILLGSKKEKDVAWQLLSLSDEQVYLDFDGEKKIRIVLSQHSNLPSEVPLEFKLYFYSQDEEQALKLLKSAPLTTQEKSILDSLVQEDLQLHEIGKFKVWREGLDPGILSYLRENPDPIFTEYLLSKLRMVYREEALALENNPEISSLIMKELGVDIFQSFFRGKVVEGRETQASDLVLWLAEYEKTLSQVPEKQEASLKSAPTLPLQKKSTFEESEKEIREENPRSLSWLYWMLGALIFGGVGVLVWNSRKGSSAS